MHTPFIAECLSRRLLPLCLAVSCMFAAPVRSNAAPMADEHTVIYYLLEVQRQYTKTCNGVRMADTPSLIPSESVRTLAEMAASSGQPLPALLQNHSLAGTQAFYGTAYGATPKEVVERLVAQDCPSLMGKNFHYIGATRNNGTWSVLMTEREPIFSASPRSSQQPFSDEAPGTANATATGAGNTANNAVQGAPQRSGVVPLEAENQPQPPFVPQEIPGTASGGVEGTPLAVSGAAASQGGTVGSAPAPYESGNQPGLSPMPNGDPYAPAPSQITAVYGPDAHLVLPAGTNGASAAAQAGGVVPAPSHAGTLQTAPGPVIGQTMPVTVAPPHGSMPPAETLLSMINQTRAKGYQCGGTTMPPVPPLKVNPTLQTAAAAHTADMIAKNYFASTSPAGVTLGQRLTAAGYMWVNVGETIAAVQPPASMALETWLYQENQCKLLLSPDYTEAGAAFERSKNYWVFTLARPMEMEEGGIRLE